MKRLPARILAPVLLAAMISPFAPGCKTPATAVSDSQPVQPTPTMEENYIELKPGKSISGHVGQNVWVLGQEAAIVHQHMMKGSFNSTEKHIYLDYNNGAQVVAYYRDINVPTDKGQHKFYGKVGSMTGAGKGGGGDHTEYYIDLHKVE